ncbi:uncharacterized protein LOC111334055 [Stylophora pistillata]|uniref:Uncharacterized protein n=1 Tax=Stylophora pistillata TaxID=50429 RepID=A0A2B4S1Y3_STYPI|nr:uncharacterized protein LOC111334055 [Stylophora pistillata]PFX22587.1 hypothetical protein AWC38_SpisGene12899 [Stylophora pistillata]
MFQPKKTEEVESDSDWDSLPGDVQEPSSSPDSTPRHQPAPPPHSPKGHVSQKRPQIKSQAAIATPEKNSITNTPVTQPVSKPGTPASSNRPSQLYGKPGITTFVDRSLNSTSVTDNSLENSQNQGLSPNINENRLQKERLGRQNEGIHLEMNEVDNNGRNPPFTDFQANLPQQNAGKLTQNEKPKAGKIKPSYLATKEANHGNHSWDSDSEQEQELVTHSREPLTPRQKNSKKGNHEEKSVHLEHETAIVENYGKSLTLETCCVPLETRSERQISGRSYHFDHGHNHHFDVRPEWKEAYMKGVADRSEKWLHYFWQEFFSTVRIITDFAFIFVLELLRFVFHYVLLRVLGGIIIVVGDHFLKPYLALVFNSIIQPAFIFTWNVLSGIRNLLQPLMDISSVFITQLGSLLRAFRLFELNWKPVYERGQKHDVHVL